MNAEGKPEQRDDENEIQRPVVPKKKKRKTEPEVIIAPTGPGGPDVTVE
jgi:hypothetical protein